MKPVHDLVIGGIAVAMGCLLIGSAIFQSPLLMQLPKSRLLAESVGATAARWIIVILGLALIALGGLIASGWRVHW
jgi:hypothetical protein